MTRRDFFKLSLKGVITAGLAKGLFELVKPEYILASTSNIRRVFLIDAHECCGCGLCIKACKLENEIPYESSVSRTWIERYVLTKDGKVHADATNAGKDGFTSTKIDLGMGKYKDIKKEDIDKAFFVPKLCNQCENPSCVQVCPVGATYQAADGVVLVDRKWCIGCGYCIMACPYGVRFFHPKYRTAEKCNFCYHRISKGLKTACVQACVFGSRKLGNLKDPNDPVTKTIMTERVWVLKEEYGTKPQVYYTNLSMEVR